MKELKTIIRTCIAGMMLMLVPVSGITMMTSCQKDDIFDYTTLDPDDETKGTLEVNGKHLKVENKGDRAELHARYKHWNGLYMPGEITVTDNNGTVIEGKVDGDEMVYELPIGTYVVSANGLSIKIEVVLGEFR